MRIEVRDVSKRYGRVTALDAVSFELAPSSRVALIGPNGSGKSTLNRVLMGLLTFEGCVRLDGRCPFDERVDVAHEIAYVPQIAPALGAPVGDVVRAIGRVRNLSHESIDRVARELGLDLRAVAARPFRTLSGGSKQKLLIALAFASRASLLILDEPTGSLDARARERFFALCDELAADLTLILCSHRLDEIRPLVDHVLRLDDGRITYDGPTAALLERCALAAIDVWIDEDSAGSWLAARGFRRTATAAWHRILPHADKLAMLSEITRELGTSLRDVSARDLDEVDLTRAMSAAHGAAASHGD